jgi:hypothetical protein
MEVGNRIRIQGMEGIVVALIGEGKFSPDYSAENWGYLEVGMLVDTAEIGLVHYADMNEFKFEIIAD